MGINAARPGVPAAKKTPKALSMQAKSMMPSLLKVPSAVIACWVVAYGAAATVKSAAGKSWVRAGSNHKASVTPNIDTTHEGASKIQNFMGLD